MSARHRIRFLLNDQPEEISDCQPTDTVLEFLRERRGLTGSKEGCAEGDCGACTVVLAEPVDGRLSYRAFNACILFLPALDGKQLITIEGLAGPDGRLHPVQQAMVDLHGSQCGFCTPGFVMSLFALYHSGKPDPDPAAARQAINETLAGNLCRCTGYTPIVEAAQAALAGPADDQFSRHEAATIKTLETIHPDGMLEMVQSGRRYFAPTTLAELHQLQDAWPDAVLVAGATDVGLWVTKQLRQPETVIQTTRVGELRELFTDDNSGELVIGAAVSYSEALPALTSAYPEFGELLSRLGALQVRNAGTIGGNIANGSPIGDMPPGLIALGTTLVLAGSRGRRSLPLEDFFIRYGEQDLQAGECVAQIRIPPRREGQWFRTYKLSRRIEQDISAVCGAFSMEVRSGLVNDVRICFGGMAGIPKRAGACEAALRGEPWTEASVQKAMTALADDFTPIDDMRASANYRMSVARNLLYRCFLESSDVEYPTRLHMHPAARADVSAP